MKDLNYKDFYSSIPENIYLPSDDSFLILDVLKKEITKVYEDVLEIGPGSGILSLYLYNFADNLTLADIDENVITYLYKIKSKYDLNNFNIVKSDLFSNLDKIKKYDVIVFNPPYVPSDKKEIICDDGGQNGSEIIIKFINLLNLYLKKEGKCYLLVSTLNNISDLKKNIENNKLNFRIISEKSLFFEKLLVLEIKK